MSAEEVASPESEDFDVEFKIRLPRAVARRLLSAAEARRVDAGPLASAVVAKALGAEVRVPPAQDPPTPRFTDPAVRAELRKLHAAGMTVLEIAANLNTHRSTIVRWLEQLELAAPPGSKRGPKGPRTPQIKPKGAGGRPFAEPSNLATFEQMYQAGSNDYDIAKVIGCSGEAVRRQRQMRGWLPNGAKAAS